MINRFFVALSATMANNHSQRDHLEANLGDLQRMAEATDQARTCLDNAMRQLENCLDRLTEMTGVAEATARLEETMQHLESNLARMRANNSMY